ncbi:MAG: PilT/PilU family type 4a pilus ATPase [Acidimicrobiia bacterium]|nr:PilT/PilU family type 4a pilus ATPase [Acidimicrobiia bacterium]
MHGVERQLREALVDRRLLSRDDLEEHLHIASDTDTPLVSVVVESGAARARDVLAAVADHIGVRFVAFEGYDKVTPDPDAVNALTRDSARELQALPVETDSLGRLVVAVDDPLDEGRHGRLRQAAHGEVVLALAHRGELMRAIDSAYDVSAIAAAPAPGASDREAATLDATINDLLVELLRHDGSDLHVTAGSPPQMRVHGKLYPVPGFGTLRPAETRDLIYAILTTRQRTKLEEERELDFSHPVYAVGRFRVNVFFQRDAVGAVMRAIPSDISTLEALAMPPVVSEFANLSRGLVLVTGPTGSGKSTTLASLIDLINRTRASHIVTIEDPIEFTHAHKKAIVNQREVGIDTLSFAAALRHSLRQDPDVILVGEMRDLETVSTALTAAETGHLVFGTLHTQDAPKSVERIIDVFPVHQQHQVRVQLASSLAAIVSQQLLVRSDATGRAAAVEVMVATPAIRNLIREGKVHQITSAMQAGGRYGMQTMDAALAALVLAGTVQQEQALERAIDPDSFLDLVGRSNDG